MKTKISAILAGLLFVAALPAASFAAPSSAATWLANSVDGLPAPFKIKIHYTDALGRNVVKNYVATAGERSFALFRDDQNNTLILLNTSDSAGRYYRFYVQLNMLGTGVTRGNMTQVLATYDSKYETQRLGVPTPPTSHMIFDYANNIRMNGSEINASSAVVRYFVHPVTNETSVIIKMTVTGLLTVGTEMFPATVTLQTYASHLQLQAPVWTNLDRQTYVP